MAISKNSKKYVMQRDIFDIFLPKEIPDYIRNCAVTDCKTVEEFAIKYRKQERFTGRGEEYVRAVMNTHYKDLERFGYTCISHHDNVTGKFIAFIKSDNI